jgi:pectin methylesterase-like acyl-CoA thioesterase
MAEQPADSSFRTRLALALTFGVTLTAACGVLAALALSGPSSVATGATALGTGVCVVAAAVALLARDAEN